MKGKEKEGSLQKRLLAYGESDYYGFHMPGHKRQMGEPGILYRMDITEIDGFDDLHHPQEQGILARAQERAARLYGAEETHFLINGSTAGILSAISGCTHFGGCILMGRNSHRSAYHGVGLRNLKPCYLYPQLLDTLWINGGISPEDVENSLNRHREIEAVFVTSPTYEGICSDIGAMARICHERGVPLIVDQAHGAHFPFSRYFPEDAVKAGADVVIQSVHKTLPALTQTALLHLQGELVDRERIRYYLSVYQSSSPSYVLMASIDSCMERLEREGRPLFDAYTERLEEFRNGCERLERLKLVGKELVGKAEVWDFDNSRLVISTGDAAVTGEELARRLRTEYHLEMEMASERYVTGISGVADTKEAFQRLGHALFELDEDLRTVEGAERMKAAGTMEPLLKAQTVLPPGTALERDREWLEVGRCRNRTAADALYLYPPGIPLVVPGELFTEQLCSRIQAYLMDERKLHGTKEDGRIAVIKEQAVCQQEPFGLYRGD